MESVFIKDGIDYGNLHTRKDFYEYVQEDIRENVWEMTDGELDITVEYCRLLDFFQGLTVTRSKRKKRLEAIVLGASRNFVKCLRGERAVFEQTAQGVRRRYGKNQRIFFQCSFGYELVEVTCPLFRV